MDNRSQHRMDTRKGTALVIGDFTITRAGQVLPNVSDPSADQCALQMLLTRWRDEKGVEKYHVGINPKTTLPVWWGERHQHLAQAIVTDYAHRIMPSIRNASGGFVLPGFLEERDT